MALEIERRFLVVSDDWKLLAREPQLLRQAYLTTDQEAFIVRIRILGDEAAWLTVKLFAEGFSSHEFEYGIPMEDAEQLWRLCPHRIRKTRFALDLTGERWVVDCFEDANFPLVLAEVELPGETAPLTIPPWCGRELTGDMRWSNVSLAIRAMNNHSNSRLYDDLI